MLLPRTASPWPPWPVGAPRARSLTAAGAREVEWLSRLAGLEGAGVVRRGGLASLSPWNDASSACRAASAAASTAAALALAARDAGDWPSLLACAHMRGLVWRASVG